MIDLISNIPPSGSASDYAFGAVAFHRGFTAAITALGTDLASDPEAVFADFMAELIIEDSPVNLSARSAIVGLFGGCSMEEFDDAFLGYVQEARESFLVKVREHRELAQPAPEAAFSV